MLSSQDSDNFTVEPIPAEGAESASLVVKQTFDAFGREAVDLEQRAAKLLTAAATRSAEDIPGDPTELLNRTIQQVEELLAKAGDAEGLNAVLRTSDILDAAGKSWAKIQAILDQAEAIWTQYGYVSPYTKTFQSPPPPTANVPMTPANLFSPAPPKSAHLPDTPTAGGRESTGTVSTMSAPQTPAVLKEKRPWDRHEEAWEESPSMETLAGGLSERGLAILREGMAGTPQMAKNPDSPAPATISPPKEPEYHASPPCPHAPYAGAHLQDSPAQTEEYAHDEPSTPNSDGPRLDGEDMEDTFANLNIHDFGGMGTGRSRVSMPPPRSLIQLNEEDEDDDEDMPEPVENTFTSRLPLQPTTPGTGHTRTRIPVLTPKPLPVSDSLYPLLAPVEPDEYNEKMDSFGMRATPLDWLNEAISTVNEALTDARFDEVDAGAGWNKVTVKELEIMLNLPEGKVTGFVTACLKLGRLVPTTKRGEKAYNIVE